MEVSPSFEELRGRVDAALERFLSAPSEELSDASLLVTEIRRLVEAGGKRLRPLFCYWGYRAGGGVEGEAIVEAAAALELLHTFALVHDDIMDESARRRGQATVHSIHGIGVGLLTGDLALVLADDCFLSSGFEPDALGRGFSVYSRMRRQVIAGQFLDLEAEHEVVSEERARKIAILKSGRYSVRDPLLIGAALAGADDAVTDGLAAFGELLGEAFQLRDDLLGAFGESATVGKPVDSDIKEGKRNLLFAKAAARLGGEERALFLDRWGHPKITDDEIDRLRDLLVRSGARAETETLLYDLAASATKELESLDLDEPSRSVLLMLVRSVVERER